MYICSKKAAASICQIGESGFAKPNHKSSNIKIFGRWMNTEIIVVVNNVYKPESVFSHDGNTVFRKHAL
jgi:hypothetical protein